MREDDDKYELKKVLIELDKGKEKELIALDELSEWIVQNKHLMSSQIRKKLDEALTKYIEACHKEKSLEEIKEGREQL